MGVPNRIAADFKNSRLYWAHPTLVTLETYMDGTDRYVIANMGKAAPAGIDIMVDYLYHR